LGQLPSSSPAKKGNIPTPAHDSAAPLQQRRLAPDSLPAIASGHYVLRVSFNIGPTEDTSEERRFKDSSIPGAIHQEDPVRQGKKLPRSFRVVVNEEQNGNADVEFRGCEQKGIVFKPN
jgi:hypothetical protein